MTGKIQKSGGSARSGRPGYLTLDPARSVIERAGGAGEVARITGVHNSRVRRWASPREKGGSDGVIPTKQALKLIGLNGITMNDVLRDVHTLVRADLAVLSALMDGAMPRDIAKQLGMKVSDLKAAEAKLRQCPRIAVEVWRTLDQRRARMTAQKLPR